MGRGENDVDNHQALCSGDVGEIVEVLPRNGVQAVCVEVATVGSGFS